ncbi:hypothetical protein EJB05_22268, partial [Eragrostis curvula]
MPASPCCGSASAIVADALSGYHVLKIVGYSRSKDEKKNGECIGSRPFRVGGHTWQALYYPKGFDYKSTDHISMYLQFLNDRKPNRKQQAVTVKAQVTLSLLDRDGNPVPSHSLTTTNAVNFSTDRYWGYPQLIKIDDLEKSEHLKDDCFTVRFDVSVMKGVRTEESVPFVVVPPSDMHRHFGDLLSSKEGADVKFQVGGKTFPAHRSVLAARSPIFKAGLYSPMKEGAATGIIQIDDMEAEVFDALLTFMYTDEFPEMGIGEESAMAQHLLVAADKYNMERLKLVCEDKLCKHIDTGSAAAMLALAEQHNCRGLKEACFEYLGSSRTLNAVMETSGFGHLAKSSTNVLKELISKVFPR